MNMFKELVAKLPNSDIMGIIGTGVLLLVFAGVVIWAIKLDKRYVDNLSKLPLETITDIANEECHG